MELNMTLEIPSDIRNYLIKKKIVTKVINNQDDGIQYIFKFPNGYGASVIKVPMVSYDWKRDLWELAVISNIEETGKRVNFSLEYGTGITDDVVGNLTNEEVVNFLYKMKGVKKK